MELFEDISTIFIITFAVTGFIAGYIDSIAGGGGMIQIPVLLYCGIPPIFVLATNKIGAIGASFMASIEYAYKKKVSWKIVSIAIIPCLMMSYIGSRLIIYASDEFIQWAILLTIPIGMLLLLKKTKIEENNSARLDKKHILMATTPVGLYDGLLGPGTGTYFAISMKKFLRIDYLKATACTKPLNFATDLGSVLAFFFAGKIFWVAAIPLGLANLLGSYIGSHYAIKGGEKFIKKVLIFVLVFMLVANLYKIIA